MFFSQNKNREKMKEVVLKPGDLSETIRNPNGNGVSRPTGNLPNKA